MKQFTPILVLLVTLLLTACTPDPCEDTICANGGTCFEGNCQCPPGFSGADCSIDDCDALNCQNGGSCEQGICDCPMEFTGRECEERVTDLFAGVFMANPITTNNCLPQEHAVVISSGTNPRDLILYNIQNDSLYTDGYLENESHITFQQEGVIFGSITPHSVNELDVQYVSNTGPDCQFILRRLF